MALHAAAGVQGAGAATPLGGAASRPAKVRKEKLARVAAGPAGIAFLSLGPVDYVASYVGNAKATVRRAQVSGAMCALL